MMAYLVMMTSRLVELHRVLKDTGSLYLHCDPTASHYLKIVLDGIFGVVNFKNEIIWQRTSGHSDAKNRFARIHDTILFYARSDSCKFSRLHLPHRQEYLDSKYRYTEPDGRRYRLDSLLAPKPSPTLTYEFLGVTRTWRWNRERMEQAYKDGLIVQTNPGTVPQRKSYLDDKKGPPVPDVWTDISPINSQAAERLGYPTQKPVALLERIISASSNPDDVVLDPFCGCGTAVHAAEKLGRRWIGIDITHLAIALISQRMHSAFPDCKFKVTGTPRDVAAARYLAENNGLQGRYQFQYWALSLVDAMPDQHHRRGPDGGIDGAIWAYDSPAAKAKPFRIIVSVKSGKIPANHIRELRGLIDAGKDRDNTQMALLLTLEKPSRKMQTEAVAAGKYVYPGGQLEFPRIQILTIEELLAGKKPEYVDYGDRKAMNRQAKREAAPTARQRSLLEA